MTKQRILFFSTFFVADLALAILLDDPILAGIILVSVFMPCYIALSLYRQKKRIQLLDDDCDPEAFIEATEKQYAITGKSNFAHINLTIDKCAGLASLGRFEEANKLMLSLNPEKVTRNKLRGIVYYNNLMLCYEGIGEIETAKVLYHEKFVPFTNKLSKQLSLSKLILFSKLKYEVPSEDIETRQQIIHELKSFKLSKRLSLHLKIHESELAVSLNDIELAKSLLNEIVSDGKKLHIVDVALEKLENLS